MNTDLGKLTHQAQKSAKSVVDNIANTSSSAIIVGDMIRISRAELEKYLTTFIIDLATMGVCEGINSVLKR